MLYDDIGCMATLPGDYTIQLRSRGIEAHKFNKVIPRLTVAYNNRDHLSESHCPSNSQSVLYD